MGGGRRWLINRVTITLTVIAMVAAGWNLYVAAHDDGILEGIVIGPSGEPVQGAKVVLSERTIVSLAPIAEVTTDAEGRFRFDRHDRHALVLNASRQDLGRSGRIEIRLYFRNQNRLLDEPIGLASGARD